jgi:hypothetical protein
MALKKRGRKLLVASVGVAAVSYVACGGENAVANLMIIPADGGKPDATADATKDQTPPPPNWDVIANLIPPPRD